MLLLPQTQNVLRAPGLLVRRRPLGLTHPHVNWAHTGLPTPVWWPMGAEGAGTEVRDLIGQQPAATVVGTGNAVLWRDGALEFQNNGSTPIQNVALATDLFNDTRNFTLFTRLKRDVLSSHHIFASAVSNGCRIFWYSSLGNRIELWVGSSVAQWNPLSKTVAAGEEHTLALVRHSTTSIELFLDGKSEGTKTISGTQSLGWGRIGAMNTGAWGFDGLVLDHILFEEALLDEQIVRLNNNDHLIALSGSVADWLLSAYVPGGDTAISGGDRQLALEADAGNIQADVDTNISGNDRQLALEADAGDISAGADTTITGNDRQLALEADSGTINAAIDISGTDLALALQAQNSPISLEISGLVLLDRLNRIERFVRNRFDTNPSTGKAEVWNDAGDAVLYRAPLYKDIAGTQPYAGDADGAQRRDRFEEV